MSLDMTALSADDMLAFIAGNLAGGAHAWRADAAIKADATVHALKNRKAKNARRMSESRWYKADARERAYAEYDVDTLATIAELHAVWATMPKRRALRNAWRAILHDTADCKRCADDTCERATYPADWRDLVRAYRDGKARADELGAFAIKRDDMRMTTSLYAHSARKQWKAYAGGEWQGVHGHDYQDAVQRAFVSCIESGDTITRKTHTGAMEHVPTYGAMWSHLRQSVYALASHRAESGMRTFGTGNDEIAEFVFAEFEPRTVAEWLAYESHRDILDSQARTTARIAREREERLTILSDVRKSFATLIGSGMTVRRIANMLGRTVDGILKDLDADTMPAPHALPVVVTDWQREDAQTRVLAQAAHAHRLRAVQTIRATIQGGSLAFATASTLSAGETLHGN
jgi:hypothetical protein